MNRRVYLALAGTVVGGSAIGYASLDRSHSYTDPSVEQDPGGSKYLTWSDDGEALATLGVGGSVTAGTITSTVSVSHHDRPGTHLTSISLRIWMPETEPGNGPEISVVGPLQGDIGSEPPEISLYRSRDRPGTIVEVDDFDDLKDETVNIRFNATPQSEIATTLAFDPTVELEGTGFVHRNHTLKGTMEVDFQH